MTDLIQAVDCLSESEVEKVLSLLETRQWKPSTVFIGRPDGSDKSVSGIVTDIRNNSRYCAPDDSEESAIMHQGMNAALLTYRDTLYHVSPHYATYPVPGSHSTSCYREQIQVLKYEHEEHYSWHTDQASDVNVHERGRTISVVLYLKNADDGGRTIFPHRAFKPKAGQALIFPSNWCFPHSAEPVKAGTKIVAVTWYYSNYEY